MSRKTKRIVTILLVVLAVSAIALWLIPNRSQEADNGDPLSLEGVISHIYIGNCTMFALQPNGSLWTWGMVVGRFYAENTLRWEPILPPELVDIPGEVVYVSTAGFGNASNARNHAMAITADGTLWGWGANDQGQIGDGGNSGVRAQPVAIMDDVAFVATSGFLTMAITYCGNLWGWGDNNLGQLGTDSIRNSFTPIWIMNDVATVILGGYHVLAIRMDGSLWTWGSHLAMGIDRPFPVTDILESAPNAYKNYG